MARSLYKGERLGKTPACAICVGAGRGGRALLYLPCGVRVWLCEAHRSPEFLSRRAGRDLVASLWHVWSSADCLTARRSRALDLHRARLTGSLAVRERPGSYSWAALRSEAEVAFAAGEPPARVIDRLRRRAMASGEARAPSVRTMRRWFREGRWLAGPPAAGDPSPPHPGHPRPPAPDPSRSGADRVTPPSRQGRRPVGDGPGDAGVGSEVRDQRVQVASSSADPVGPLREDREPVAAVGEERVHGHAYESAGSIAVPLSVIDAAT